MASRDERSRKGQEGDGGKGTSSTWVGKPGCQTERQRSCEEMFVLAYGLWILLDSFRWWTELSELYCVLKAALIFSSMSKFF